ncbi:hypothetical protein [Enterococcus phage PEF1]
MNVVSHRARPYIKGREKLLGSSRWFSLSEYVTECSECI